MRSKLFVKSLDDMLDPEEEHVSYNVESLFTSIPVSEINVRVRIRG